MSRIRSSLIHFLMACAAILALMGAYAGYVMISHTLKNQERQGAPLPSAGVAQEPMREDLTVRQNLWTSDDPVRGSADAPISIIEFSDFACPYCGEAYPIIKQLMNSYGSKIRFQYRDFPISDVHPRAQSAAEAAECASMQGKFWEYHDMLFEHQANFSREDLGSYARAVGLNLRLFNQCLDSRTKTNEVIADFKDGRAAGVEGTPTFFINGARYAGVYSLDELEAIIGNLLQK